MSEETSLSIKTLLVPSKFVEVDFPGFDGFKLNLSYMSRQTILGLRKKATKPSFKGRQYTEDFDEKLFLKLYTAEAIKGWSGFTYEYLSKLAPTEIDEADFAKLVPYTQENALAMMESSVTFDSFVSETVSELSSFTKDSTQK